ncbi:hypothetical protein Tco_0193784 [Tanacetum coccineum]
MAKIVLGEGITRSVFCVKGVDLREEEAPYWTTLRKKESYKPQPSSDRIGAKPPYYARKDFLDFYLPGEWEISRDVELNPFKDTLVFRIMNIPELHGNTSPDPLDDLSKYLLASLAISHFHDDPYMKVMQAYNATSNESPIPPPQAPIALPIVFEIGESSHKMHLERHEEQIETILNNLDELPLERIEHMEDK